MARAKDPILSRYTVLAIDDNEANLLAIEAVLENDCDVMRARSGEEAVELLESDRGCGIDVILLDVHMPQMDGFETAQRIRKIEACSDVPIVFITAVYKEDPYVKKGYEVGGIDYFSKPFDPDVLKMKVAVYASFRQKAKILQERERQVRESEELLRVGRKLASVLESLPVGVLIADTGGRIRQTTEEVSRILRADEKMDSESYGKMLAWWDSGGHPLKNLNGALTQSLSNGKSSHSEPIQILCLDGSIRTILASTSPLRGVNGAIVGAVVLIQDLTEHKEIEKDFEQRVVSLIGLGMALEQSAAAR